MQSYPVHYRKSGGGFQTGAQRLATGRDLRLAGDRDLLRFAERMTKERQSTPFRKEWKAAQKMAQKYVNDARYRELAKWARQNGKLAKTGRGLLSLTKLHPLGLARALAFQMILGDDIVIMQNGQQAGYDYAGNGFQLECDNGGRPLQAQRYTAGHGGLCNQTQQVYNSLYGDTVPSWVTWVGVGRYQNFQTRFRVDQAWYRPQAGTKDMVFQQPRPRTILPRSRGAGRHPLRAIPYLRTMPWRDVGPPPPPKTPHRHVHPGHRTAKQKEGKYSPMGRLANALMDMFGAATEAGDVVEALWEGMPAWMQAKYANAGTLSKAQMIFDQFHQLNFSKALYAYGKGQFEDMLFGLTKGAGGAQGLSPMWNRPLGPTSGFFSQRHRQGGERGPEMPQGTDWDEYLMGALGL